VAIFQEPKLLAALKGHGFEILGQKGNLAVVGQYLPGY
jgi:hypothetical protein